MAELYGSAVGSAKIVPAASQKSDKEQLDFQATRAVQETFC